MTDFELLDERDEDDARVTVVRDLETDEILRLTEDKFGNETLEVIL